jgi:Flp pilus assembly protein CpaB
MLLCVAVVIATVIAAGWLYANKGASEQVLVVDRPIPAGHPITEADVRTSTNPFLVARDVSGVPGAIPVADVGRIYGKRTTVALIPGQVLTEDAMTSSLLPAEGTRMIAIDLPTGRVPATLAPGSIVDAIVVPQEGQVGPMSELDDPTVVTAGAEVYAAESAQDGSVTVTLALSETDARAVAAYGAVGQLTLLQAPLTDSALADAQVVDPATDDDDQHGTPEEPS